MDVKHEVSDVTSQSDIVCVPADDLVGAGAKIAAVARSDSCSGASPRTSLMKHNRLNCTFSSLLFFALTNRRSGGVSACKRMLLGVSTSLYG